MFSILLPLIYLAFISLGLPDALLGSAWPTMQASLQVPLSYAGLISMIMTASTILSSLQSDRVTKKYGTGLVTAVSVLLTAVALLGFSLSSAFWMLCLLAIPYGLGAGAVDAALNNFVALHYAARHMSWLHCFWGVGASIGPFLMAYAISGGLGWAGGYWMVCVIQAVLVLVLFATLSQWDKRADNAAQAIQPPQSLGQVLKIPGVPYILIAFFGYCALETTTGLWAATYLCEFRGLTPEIGANFAALFYIGVTAGRFLCGFISDRLGDCTLTRIGLGCAALGITAILLPLSTPFALAGLILAGVGCAPIYPSMIHATPANFGRENAQAVIGVQMASAYLGSTLMPPVFGLVAEHLSVALYPLYLALFVVLILLMTERLNRFTAHRHI